jgi:hypothetical protein
MWKIMGTQEEDLHLLDSISARNTAQSRKKNRSTMTKTLRNCNWFRYVILFLAVLEIIVIYDTVRNNLNYGGKNAVRRDSAIAGINGDVINVFVPNEAGLSPDTNSYSESDADDDSDDDDSDDDSDDLDDVDDNDDNIDTSNDTRDGFGPRKVYWLNHKQFDDQKSDYYSGSWLIPMSRFESVKADEINCLEDASHNVYSSNKSEVRMAVDWLDFAVEHMSRWYKRLDVSNAENNDVAINKITGNLMKYVEDTPERTKALISTSDDYPLLHPTIAIISSYSMVNNRTHVSRSRSKNLTVTTLGATIASLMRAGIGRIVCTGIDKADELAVTETYRLLLEQYANRSDWIATTEFSYVQVDEELYKAEAAEVNRPKAAVYGLQKALRRDFAPPYTERWLGNTHPPSYWKYVYFTEPDLVLQTRATSLPAIHKALEEGHMLMPHRLELIAHKSDLTKDNIVYDRDNFLPARGKFTDILDLDGDEDMCCDGGNNRPSWGKKVVRKNAPTDKKCPDWWWNCGYFEGWQNLGLSDEVKHRRILKYTPFIRLTQGTDIIAISGTEHERKCHPRKRQTPNDICERPSQSGRSFAT